MNSLLERQTIQIPAGAWRGRELRQGGRTIGWADRGVVSDADGQLIADLRRALVDGHLVWNVEDAFSQTVGSLVPATRVNWRGKTKPVKTHTPFGWSGTVRLAGSTRDVAHVRAGAVVALDGRLAAEVLVGDSEKWWGSKSMWGEWTLRFRACDDPRLRVMCFGWLALAWNFQHTIDNSD
jgi:hypothetical protein